MSSILLNNYPTNAERNNKEYGEKSCPIWLLVNPRYPTDIPNIWSPIIYEIQDIVFRKLRARIDSRNIFIKAALSDIGRIPKTTIEADVSDNILMLRESILEHQPKLLITFGSITNEFVRRAFNIQPENETKYWNTSNLGNEFERSISNFDITQTNWIPIIRRATKTTKNIKDWEGSSNYYHIVATKIADKILENKDSLKIWI